MRNNWDLVAAIVVVFVFTVVLAVSLTRGW